MSRQDEKALALAVNIGFGTKIGRIIRAILNRESKHPDLTKKILYYQIFVLLIGCLLYLVALWRMNQYDVDKTLKVLRFFDFLPYSFPPVLLIFFNMCYNFSLIRLYSQ